MWNAWKRHWPEYGMEAAGLGLFMLSACSFATLLAYPGSAVHLALPDPTLRRGLMGLAMGLTAIGLIYSPWGKQSGAHFNPAVTFTFWRLGKIAGWDAGFYVLAQFIGGSLGVMLAAQLLRDPLAHPSVHYAVTAPGGFGLGWAFAGELVISFLLMSMVLRISNSLRLNRFTGLFAGTLVALYILLEDPISGMSMNPARTWSSALSARDFSAWWIYFSAPLAGMLLAAELYVHTRGRGAVRCAKLHHMNQKRCIFRCGFHAPALAGPDSGGAGS
ncbi:MAG TPA: aquaporin [Acidobacteriota bacterium]